MVVLVMNSFLFLLGWRRTAKGDCMVEGQWTAARRGPGSKHLIKEIVWSEGGPQKPRLNTSAEKAGAKQGTIEKRTGLLSQTLLKHHRVPFRLRRIGLSLEPREGNARTFIVDTETAGKKVIYHTVHPLHEHAIFNRGKHTRRTKRPMESTCEEKHTAASHVISTCRRLTKRKLFFLFFSHLPHFFPLKNISWLITACWRGSWCGWFFVHSFFFLLRFSFVVTLDTWARPCNSHRGGSRRMVGDIRTCGSMTDVEQLRKYSSTARRVRELRFSFKAQHIFVQRSVVTN